jgi:hypothetical protein
MRFDKQIRRNEAAMNPTSPDGLTSQIFISGSTRIPLGHRFDSFLKMNYQNRYEA